MPEIYHQMEMEMDFIEQFSVANFTTSSANGLLLFGFVVVFLLMLLLLVAR